MMRSKSSQNASARKQVNTVSRGPAACACCSRAAVTVTEQAVDQMKVGLVWPDHVQMQIKHIMMIENDGPVK